MCHLTLPTQLHRCHHHPLHNSPHARRRFEKYAVDEVGAGGGGGEYVPQLGFGFTNGAALDLLVRFNFDTLEAPSEPT